MSAPAARHETRALLRAHLAAASGYRHITRHCPICYRLLRLAMEPVTAPQAPHPDPGSGNAPEPTGTSENAAEAPGRSAAPAPPPPAPPTPAGGAPGAGGGERGPTR
ncbi:DUF6274 family protein [Streptomyces sp. NBC_00887]|uniref:DUF6274 family protein n=1 Tax=Streptomyces sp. NBC_00887 TaxID=2975859 RepID=UPI003868698A|nr:DUF6274 family protein [Streptomyces sp. NBC_00887]